MKKISLLLLTLTICFFTACHKDIWAELENLDQRVTKLEELCKEMNTNITSLQTIVSVLQSNDYITGIVEIKKNGDVIGYTITFGTHDPITIYNGEDGSSIAPIIGVGQDTDGIYYWTLNGEWLLDENGNKLPVTGSNGQNGTMPLLKIEEGYWCVSYDDGTTWTELGKAVGEDGNKGDKGDSMFQSVTQDENYVYFILADGTVIQIAKGNGGNNQVDNKYTFIVTYDANGGEGVMLPDTFYYGQAMRLSASKYINGELIFTCWNTQPDGSGIDFQDEQEIVLDRDIVLYAKWKEYKSGKFSVSSSKYVSFALGNLQYHSLSGIYRFAKNQYDYIGVDNLHDLDPFSYYDGWIDLFAYRWSSSSNTFLDWGRHEIDNYPSSTWRTLSKEEWEYIIKGRTNADNLCGIAQVNGVNGFILLPDEWVCPSTITFIAGYLQESTIHSYADHQSFTKSQWNALESSGAVFLPAAGTMYDSEVKYLQRDGYYWTSTNKYILDFSWQGATVRSIGDLTGSVRLVRNVK